MDIDIYLLSTSYYSCKSVPASQNHPTIYPIFTLNTTLSKIIFSLLQSLNGAI